MLAPEYVRSLGRYVPGKPVGELARGGMGTVFLARHAGEAGFQRLFAVKVLHAHLAEEAGFVDMLRDEARIARLAADDVIDRFFLDRGIESWHHRQRLAARARGALDQRKDQFGAYRAAEIHRLAHSLRRDVLGENLAERHFRRPIDDEADVLAGAERRDHQHRVRIDRIDQLRACNENHRLRKILSAERRGREQHEGEKEGSGHAATMRRRPCPRIAEGVC